MFNLFKKKPFAIQISDNRVSVMQLNGKLENAKVTAAGQSDLAVGVVTEGIIMKAEELAEAIRMLLKKAAPSSIKAKECVVVLAENQTYSQVFYFTEKLPEAGLKRALDHQIGLTIPIPFEEVVYSYCKYDTDKLRIVFVFAVKRSVIASYSTFLKQQCGLTSIAFDPAALSFIANLKLGLPKNNGAILIYLKDGSINWYLLWNSLLFDSNTLLWKDQDNLGKDLQRSISFFQEKTGFGMEKILIVDSTQSYLELEKALAKLQLPIEKCEKFGVDMKDVSPKLEHSEILAGGALRAVDPTAGEFKINLL
jgi:hypothetical protein